MNKQKKTIVLHKANYESGKIAVKRAKLYSHETFEKIEKLNFDEILKFMQENDYTYSIDKSYLNFEGFYLIERILNLHTSRIYKEIFSSSKGVNREFLDAYYLKYQIHNLMALIRCNEVEEEELEVYLIGDERKKSKFLKAFSMPSVEDAVVYISKKLGFNSREVLDFYKKGIFYLENYLYKVYNERLTEVEYKYNLRDEVKFSKYVTTYIDLLNSRAYLRLRVEDVDMLKFEELFIFGGKQTIGFFKGLDGFGVADVLKRLNSIFSNIGVCEDSSCIASIDKRINEHRSVGKSVFRSIKFGSPFYILRYLFDVEQEVSKLRILLKSKYLDMDEREIKEMVI